MTKYTGIIKWFNAEKGYGFIIPDTDDKDVFLHFSAFRGTTPEKNLRVTYELEVRRGRQQAANVHPIVETKGPQIGDIVQGTVKFLNWNEDKLYGFIAVPGLDKDVFLHCSDLDMPEEQAVQTEAGVRVAFTLTERKQGYRARGVTMVDTDKVVPLKRA
jgi:CspA family cold shock protein